MKQSREADGGIRSKLNEIDRCTKESNARASCRAMRNPKAQ